MKWFMTITVAALTIGGLLVGNLTGRSSEAAEGEKFKVYLSMSYHGNDWQAENANMMQAMAKSKNYRDKVDVEVQVAMERFLMERGKRLGFATWGSRDGADGGGLRR